MGKKTRGTATKQGRKGSQGTASDFETASTSGKDPQTPPPKATKRSQNRPHSAASDIAATPMPGRLPQTSPPSNVITSPTSQLEQANIPAPHGNIGEPMELDQHVEQFTTESSYANIV